MNAQRGQLQGETLADAFEGELGGVVHAHAGESPQPANASDVEDVARAALAQVRQHRPQHVQHAKHVHVELPVRFFGAYFFDAAHGAVASVVHHHVEVVETGNGVGNSGFYLGFVGHIAHHAEGAAGLLGGERRCLLGLAEGGGNAAAVGENMGGQGFAKTGRGPGDEPGLGGGIRHNQGVVKW